MFRRALRLPFVALVVVGALVAPPLAQAMFHRKPVVVRTYPVAKPFPVHAGGRTFLPVSFDGHVHTRYSHDAVSPPVDVAALGRSLGLDAIIFTDHGSTRAAEDAEKHGSTLDVASGAEVGGAFGHALLWNVPRRQLVDPAVTSLARRGAYAHAHDGLVVLAHPGWWIRGNAQNPMKWLAPEAFGPKGLSRGIDAVEIWNGVYHGPTRRLVRAWTHLLDLGIFVPIVGDSDFHNPRVHHLGHPRNVALCPVAEVECVFDAIRHGRSYVTGGPALAFRVGDAVSGETVHAAPGTGLEVAVEAVAPLGGTLVVFVGEDVRHTVTLDAGAVVKDRVTLPMPATDSYVRVEIEGTDVGRHGPSLELLSNPVLLRPDAGTTASTH